jgi:hypothetical protein
MTTVHTGREPRLRDAVIAGPSARSPDETTSIVVSYRRMRFIATDRRARATPSKPPLQQRSGVYAPLWRIRSSL